MLAGYPPFYDCEPIGIYKKIIKGIIEFPKFFSLRTKDVIRKLLNPEIKYRLGCNDDGDSIKNHKWFRGVDFDMVLNKKIPIMFMSSKHVSENSEKNSYARSKYECEKILENFY